MAKTQPNPKDQRLDAGDINAMRYATDVDRRSCERIVPMKVLALGVSRSGTSSLRQALIDLGYKDCYHYAALLQENPRDQDMWNEAYEAKFLAKGKPFERKDWDQLLGHCQAITDTPCTIFYKELLEAYSDAKVILTVRDNVDQWHKSALKTVVAYYEDFGRSDVGILTRLSRQLGPVSARMYKFLHYQFAYSPMFVLLLEDYRNGTDKAKKWYLDYIEEIKSIVPKERLLVMNVKEGWHPLCAFLGEEEPSYPFPRKNDTATFQRNSRIFGSVVNDIVKWNLLKTIGMAVTVGSFVAFGAHRFGLLRIPAAQRIIAAFRT